VLPVVVFRIEHWAFGIDGDTASEEPTYRILVAENARAAEVSDLDVIRSGLRHRDPAIHRIAVRALGRLERPELVNEIAASLDAPDAGVRVEAANALGQAIWGLEPERTRDARTGIVQALGRRLAQESEPDVRGAIARTLGRLDYETEDEIRRAEALLAPFLARSLPEQEGAVKGLERLFRSRPARVAPAATVADQLRRIVRDRVPTVGAALPSERYARVRRLALQTLGASGALDEATADAAFRDPDWQLRRLAVNFGATGPFSRAMVSAALTDSSPHVRFDAVRRLIFEDRTCDRPSLIVAARDADPHVAREAVRLLSGSCGDLDVLPALARQPGDPIRWRLASQALVSLAGTCGPARAGGPAPKGCAEARALLARHARDRRWETRMYAAAAASRLEAHDVIRALLDDSHPNVRTEAIRAIERSRWPAYADAFVRALRADDYQLVMVAASALADGRTRRVSTALIEALERLSSRASDTSRDPRLSILRTLTDVGSADLADRLRSFLHDFDPAVARQAADTIGAWTGRRAAAAPRARRSPPPWTLREYRALTSGGWRAVVRMRTGGRFEIELLADEAPATAARFIRLARSGAYDGLTFHRVEPNFVIQGGSPGANEYAGHDPYLRDEVGLTPHLRGAVGISTRGRDTGDAQLFIDLVDLPRLDHRYTVFARVVAGLDVVDGILEGGVIDRISILPADATRPAELQN
jgi:cyclophilin family peptidyl-prolyl cis-trans isomerase